MKLVLAFAVLFRVFVEITRAINLVETRKEDYKTDGELKKVLSDFQPAYDEEAMMRRKVRDLKVS